MENQEISEIDYKLNIIIKELCNQSNAIKIPNKKWFRLKECCELKGINYRTARNKTSLQPNGGKNEKIVAGNKVFSRETLLEWLEKTDYDISFSNYF